MKIRIDENGYVNQYGGNEGLEFEGELPQDFHEKFFCYKLDGNELKYDVERLNEIKLKKKKLDLREIRQSECFSVLDRSPFFYEKFTENQVNELKNWYKNWLNVTETLEIPTKPGFLKTEDTDNSPKNI